MKQIIVEISPTGEVKIEAAGFKGNSCEAATKAIETALGKAGDRKKKPEYTQTDVRTQSN